MQVFELAKQMGLETIALMNKLREFKVPVKSHMADLDDETLKLIDAKFAEEKLKDQEAEKAKKKTVRKKTTTTKAASQVVSATKVSTITRATTAVVTKKKVEAAAPAPIKKKKSAAAEDAAEAAKKASTVIRRRPGLVEAPTPEAPAPEEVVAPVGEETGGDQAVAPVAASPAPAAVPEKHDGRARVLGMAAGFEAPAPKKVEPPKPTSAIARRPGESEASREEREKLLKQEALAAIKKAAAGPKEQKVEEFVSAEFKKREMLFQPKKKKVLVGRAALKTQITTPGAQKRKIKIEGGITVGKLASAMGVKSNQIVKQLMNLGSMVTVNDILDPETANVIAAEHKFEIENVAKSEMDLLTTHPVEGQVLKPRGPIVTVMGHVDHGKTSLLDAIRSAKVAAGEAGGITQHIGAYSVDVKGHKITFLDTPGHEAFTAMRARGAKVTDIVILVVAADDGIMPQTREAIQHAKAAGVPIIVAVNKMDLPQANPQRVLQGLTEFELVPEEWGGTTIVAKVSAAKKEGIDELLESLLLQAEILDLKAAYDVPAAGTVIESRVDRGRGVVATVIVQQGIAKVGDILVAGNFMGKIRAMNNDKGSPVKQASPGEPVEILGLNGAPMAGEKFNVVADEDTARQVIEKRVEELKLAARGTGQKMTLDQLFAQVQNADVKELALVVKADVQGSAEALKDQLTKLSDDKVKIKVLAANVGGITESDVLLASTSNAIIIGFNVRPETGVNNVAEREGVQIKNYSIIYEVLDDLKKAMKGMLEPTFIEKTLGRAEVRSLFNVSKVGTIAGCSVVDGRITRQAMIRLLRDSRIIYEGKLSSLKRFKDDVREVQHGFECGIGIENYNDLKVGDLIEAYVKEQAPIV